MSRPLVIPPTPNWYLSQIMAVYRDYVVFGSRLNVVVYQWSSTFDYICTFLGHSERVTCVSINVLDSNLSVVSGSEDARVKLWDVCSSSIVKEHNAHRNNKIMSIDWHNNGDSWILSGDDKGCLSLWLPSNDFLKTIIFEREAVSVVKSSCNIGNVVAIGYRNGAIIVATYSGKTLSQLKRIRSQEQRIDCISWCPVASNDDKVPDFVASSSDRILRFYHKDSTRVPFFFKVPTKKSSFQSNMRFYCVCLWYDLDTIIAGTTHGEIVKWNLQTGDMFEASKICMNSSFTHSKCVLNLVRCGDVLFSHGLDRNIAIWNFDRCLLSFSTLGGFTYCVGISPVDGSRLAVGCGDGTIRSATTGSENLSLTQVWQTTGQQAKVTCVSWHPAREGLLAFACHDGRVGTIDLLHKQKNVTMFSTFHSKTIYSLCFGPMLPSEEIDQNITHVYSCGGEGIIWIHSLSEPTEESISLKSLIASSKASVTAFSEIAWRVDYAYVAIGYDNGMIHVLERTSVHVRVIVHVHSKCINKLAWYPHTDESCEGDKIESEYLLATVSNELPVKVVDLKDCLSKKEVDDQPPVISFRFRELFGHKSRVVDVSWSYLQRLVLASVSFDCSIQVWDVAKGCGLANYRRHATRPLTVEFSRLQPDLVYSGSEDGTLHVWRPSDQADTEPPKKKNKKDVGIKIDVSEGSGSPLLRKDGASAEAVSEIVTVTQNKAKSTKPKNYLRICAHNHSKTRPELLEDCYSLAKFHQASVPNDSEIKLNNCDSGLFTSSRTNAFSLVADEISFKDQPKTVSSDLFVWCGDVEKALDLSSNSDALSDKLVAAAALGGVDLFTRALELRVEQLMSKEDVMDCVFYLLLLNRIHEAIDLLVSKTRFREAIIIAKLRLSKDDVKIKDLHRAYGRHLETNSQAENAAKNFLAVKDFEAAAHALSIRNDVSGYTAATKICLIGNLKELAAHYASNGVFRALTKHEWEAAFNIIEMSEDWSYYNILINLHKRVLTEFFQNHKLEIIEKISQSSAQELPLDSISSIEDVSPSSFYLSTVLEFTANELVNAVEAVEIESSLVEPAKRAFANILPTNPNNHSSKLFAVVTHLLLMKIEIQLGSLECYDIDRVSSLVAVLE